MARLGGYSGENPQGEGVWLTFLQLFDQKSPHQVPFATNLSQKPHPKPVGGTPEAGKKQCAARALLDQGCSQGPRLLEFAALYG